MRPGAAILQPGLVTVPMGQEPAPRDSEDYLDPQLRARVEELKSEVASAPTSPGNVYDRVDVLWDWANAYSLTGGSLPINLPLDVTVVRWAEADGAAPDETLFEDVALSTLREYIPYIQRYIEELTLKDEHPDAFGGFSASSRETLQVGGFATVEVTYTVGSLPLEIGGGVVVGRQWLAGTEDYQNRDSTAPNFVSARTSRPETRLAPLTLRLVGPHGGQRFPKPVPAFRVEEAPLEPGDTLTLVYGDTSGGSPGMRLHRFATDRLLFPVYLDLQGTGALLTPPQWASVAVEGGPAVAVRALAPSVVAVGERFDLVVRTEDALANRASAGVPAYEIRIGEEVAAQVPAGREALSRVSDLVLDAPGTYRFTVRSVDDRLTAESNPVWVQEKPEMRVLWGETHGHTDLAEGYGSPESYFRYARDDSRLDFATLSEHDFWLVDGEWRTLQELSARYTREGRLLSFLGYEWTAIPKRGGHHNVFFRTPDRKRVPVQSAHRLPLLYEGLRADNDPDDVLVIPHAHSAGDWTQSDPDLERLAEIHSQHGSFEWFGNMYLRNGFEIGFVAASDDHRAKPGAFHPMAQTSMISRAGLAAALTPEKTPNALFDALRSRSTYATSGPRILLDARVNGRRPGTRQVDSKRREIRARASGTSPIERIDVVRNGEVLYSRHYLSAPLRPHSWLQVGFESSSEVFTTQEVDNPRPYRIWQGTLEVEGAKVVTVRPYGLDNRALDRIEADPLNPNRLSLSVRTRGRRDSLLLELEDASAATTLRFSLESTTEVGGGQGGVREPATIPPSEVELSLSGLTDGRLAHEIRLPPHTDRLTLQIVDTGAPLDQEITYTDMQGVAPGDYYYVRVTQLDGGRAWSSPAWVGTAP